MKKILITIVATVMVCACIVGGTVAWLMDSTQTVTNTFTIGNIDITLTETTNGLTVATDASGNQTVSGFKMIPGSTIEKDPKVTVVAKSEACYLFVKVVVDKNIYTDANSNEIEYLQYSIADGWTQLVDGVYYRVVDAATATNGISYSVLTDDKVTVNPAVTKEMADALYTDGNIDTDKLPTLAFTAYAVQRENVDNATTAWGYLNP